MSLIIRKAQFKDIKAIQQIASRSWKTTYKELVPEHIQDKFLDKAYSDEFMMKRLKQTILLIAEENKKVVGFANAFSKENIAELSAIYLFPEVQGKGIGTALLREIIKQLHEVNEIYVEVEKGNIIGENFYHSKGFKVVKEYEDDFFGHKLQTIQMVLNL